MKKIFAAVFLIFVISQKVSAQVDFDSYQLTDLDSLIEHFEKPHSTSDSSGAHTPGGVDCFDGQKLVLLVQITGFPTMIDTSENRKLNLYEKALKSMGYDTIPSINYTMQVQTEQGKTLFVPVQDALVDYIYQEVKADDIIAIYCLYYYNTTDGPGLLVCEFQNIGSEADESTPE